MYKLYSERIKESKGELDVYTYDRIPISFRNQLFCIICDVIKQIQNSYYKDIWLDLHDLYCREKGLKALGSNNTNYAGNAKSNFEEYISNAEDDDLLDLIDYIFHMFDKPIRNHYASNSYNGIEEAIDEAITELNYRFKQHRLGYEFIQGEIIRIDNMVVHNAYIKPALHLLCEAGFEGAVQEYINAFEARRRGDNKAAIVEAEKAFESTMKAICSKRGFQYDPHKDAAKKLIEILKSNGFFPVYLENHLNIVAAALESGSPTVRNKTAGHGQGEEIIEIPDCYAEYVIGLVAVNIVLLVKLFKGE